MRASLWALPTLLTASAIALAFITGSLDRRLSLVRDSWFVFGAGAESARGVLSTIAGSIITVTGVVFSITIVVLQLASSQFTPRVLRSFTADRTTQFVLGVFIGTFTYALLVLRTVRSEVEDFERFVPALSVTVALALAVFSIGCLIYFINHITRTIQAEVIVERVTRDALDAVARIFPSQTGSPADEGEAQEALRVNTADAAAVCARDSGYLQAVADEELLRFAQQHDQVVQMEKRVGDFVIAGDTLALVWPGELTREDENGIREMFNIGPERTRYQDVERGLIELTDIAVRALSPGVNDPTTALTCVDRLTQVLCVLGCKRFPEVTRVGRDGRVRLIARRTTFEEIIQLTFAQVRHHGAGMPAIAQRLAGSLGQLAVRLPASRCRIVHAELEELLLAARREVKSAADLNLIEEAARRARDARAPV